ncbi:MAG: hypothetical protein P4L57_06640 [Rhizomicrobium sp.]|nr:hypothetical protein [Rhizomicrobium sp.]
MNKSRRLSAPANFHVPPWAVQQKVISPVSETTPTPPSKVDAILATIQTHKTYWISGGSALAVVAIAAGLYFGGVFGPSGRDICLASLSQARDFGVISPSAELSSTAAKSTDVKGRKSCTASAGGETYTLLVDLKTEDAAHKKCKDLKKQNSCVALYSVARTDGMTTYQVREIPPGETDEALAANSPPPPPAAPDQAAAPGQAAPAAQNDGGSLDTDTAVDNTAPAQRAPQQ